jgi:hypothetical protein
MSEITIQGPWTTATESGNNGCVEVAWTKSSASGGDGCVEVARCAHGVVIGDSKLGDDTPEIPVSVPAFGQILGFVAKGGFDFEVEGLTAKLTGDDGWNLRSTSGDVSLEYNLRERLAFAKSVKAREFDFLLTIAD